ncbi:MAG: hypothetical protein IPH11_12515 [Ignavibacteriales bacterium]|nr:hypothetical protein [Ignavibacteriales bacterium]
MRAGVSQGWQKYVRDEGISISMESFGASAPIKIYLEKFGFTIENSF